MSKTSFKTSFNPGSIMSNTTTPSVVAIGGAVLLVLVAAAAFRWVRRALS